MKWNHVTGLLATASLMAAGGIWVGCNGDNSNTDGGTDSGGNDVANQQDTGSKDGGGNDAANDTGGGGIDASIINCTYYCSNILAVCGGDAGLDQYKDLATCTAMCAGIPDDAGFGTQGGDSLACRMYHLSVASTSSALAAVHCPHAGPYGYGVCGSLCNDFCEQYFAAGSPCKTDTTTGFATIDACRTYCATAAGADAAAGDPGLPQSMPAMLCREYHLENAYQTGTTNNSHCDHAGLTGGGVCP